MMKTARACALDRRPLTLNTVRDAVRPASRCRVSPAGRRRAFTLVELLVVIAIIAILAAILFPVFARARERGQRATCLSNLRQLGSAAQMYADDAEGYLPYGHDVYSGYGAPTGPTYWLQGLEPFLKSRVVARCPADPDVSDFLPSRGYASNPTGEYDGGGAQDESRAIYSSYIINGVFTDEWDHRRFRLNSVRHPSDTVLFAERDTRRLSELGWSNDDDYHPWESSLDEGKLPVYWGPRGGMAAERHASGAAYVFADGHTIWRRFSDTFTPGGLNQHLP